MNHADPPIEKKPLEHCSIGEFLQVLASDAVLPGAGAAGGVALALAAACAGKAAAITLRNDGRETLPAYLQTQLADLADTALMLAENDALQFKRQLESDDSAANNALLRTDLTILDACDTLDTLLDDNEQHIAKNVMGDWQAARALTRACRLIQESNVRELKEDPSL